MSQLQMAELAAQSSLQPQRIVVVEDEAMIAMMIEDMLQDMGCLVAGSFSNLTAALDWIAHSADDFDAALLDVNLAGETVFPVADLLSAQGKPFCFVTSYAAIPQAKTYHAHVLHKPIDPRALGAMVRSFAD